MTTDWTKDWIAKGFPWCDTCGEAAVFSEFSGYLHTTAEEPWGLHESPGGPPHPISILQWAEAGRTERAR